MKQRSLIYILSGLVIFLIIALLCIIPYKRLNVQEWNNIELFSTLKGETKSAVVSEYDATRLKGILNNRRLYFEAYSCGFTDDFGISINGRKLLIAEDGCPYLYDCANGKFLSISDSQRKEILSLFSKYGLYSPKH